MTKQDQANEEFRQRHATIEKAIKQMKVILRSGRILTEPPMPKKVKEKDPINEDRATQITIVEDDTYKKSEKKIDEPSSKTLLRIYVPSVPFPQTLAKPKNDEEFDKFLEMIKSLCIDMPLLDALHQMSKFGKFMMVLLAHHRKVKDSRISNVQDERIKNLASGPLRNIRVFSVMSGSPPVHTDQTILRIVGGCFVPNGHTVTAYISKKLKGRQCASGHIWRHVDPEMKEFYYHEFLKKYTWEPSQEEDFKKTWNTYCQKLYKDLMYKWRKDGKKLTYMLDEVWNACQRIWAAEKWQRNAVTAQNNRNPNVGGTSTGSSKHTAGSKSIVEHTIDLANTLHRPGTCWEIFRNMHKQKDDTFVDERSKAIDNDMTNQVAQASQPDLEGGDLVRLSDEVINDIYFDVVGGSKKNALYGLGSHARVAYDHVMAPRVRGRSSSQSNEVQELRLENQALRDRVMALEQSERAVVERVRLAVEQLERSVDDRVRLAVDQSERAMDERVRAQVDR
ncbi:uncharacterized protein LOC141830577 [Curcuma longa]|uniref:uncharacterized protein LOC141830577 n=1 Tax=Curcuma longa TaxID=136217 RepID=UPI003D9DC3C0